METIVAPRSPREVEISQHKFRGGGEALKFIVMAAMLALLFQLFVCKAKRRAL